MEADNGTILIFESIDLDFSETCYVPFKKPLSLADLEKEIYTFIKNNRDIDTDSIINEFNSNDSWDILDILDSLEAKDKIE